MAQFFVDSAGSDNSITITGKDFYHLTTVRRASLGDAIQIIDNNGIQYHATITQIEDGKIV
nr:16S rRNA methyltransferase [Spirochaetota bacterium]